MRRVLCAIALAIPVVVFTQVPADSVSPRAKQLHDRAIVVDSHDDTTQRLIFDQAFDIGKRNPNGNIDIPRMREGGLDALFFSIWVPSEVTGPTAVKRALDQIDAVREAVRTHPHDLMLATTAADVRTAAADHKIAALMGMEGGHMIDDVLRALARNGGVVMINYHAAFLSEEFRVASEKKNGSVFGAIAAVSKTCGDNEACATMEGERIDHEAMMKGDLPKVTWEKIIEHIDHAVKTAGV